MQKQLTTDSAVAYLQDRLGDRAPTRATLETWARPAWRRKHPHTQAPRPEKNTQFNRVVWPVSELRMYIERVREREVG